MYLHNYTTSALRLYLQTKVAQDARELVCGRLEEAYPVFWSVLRANFCTGLPRRSSLSARTLISRETQDQEFFTQSTPLPLTIY